MRFMVFPSSDSTHTSKEGMMSVRLSRAAKMSARCVQYRRLDQPYRWHQARRYLPGVGTQGGSFGRASCVLPH